MKKYVEGKEKVTNELTNWVGVVFDDKSRGSVLYTGDAYHIICNDAPYTRNRVCGGRDYDGSNIKDALQKWENIIDIIYCFDSYKELMQWFVKGIKG